MSSRYHLVLTPQGLQVFIDSLDSNKMLHASRAAEQDAAAGKHIEPILHGLH